MRAVALRLTAAAIGLVAALAIAEVTLRLVSDAPEPPAEATEIRASTSRVPHFRALAPEPVKRPGVFRVLAVGDSFTWGWGVSHDKTWAWRLSKWLPRLDSDVEFEVVSWSRPGWNTWEQWLSLREALAELEPDLILLGYVFNDAEPADPRERERIRSDIVPRTPEGPLGAPLYRSSRLAQRVYGAFENRRMRRALNSYYHGLYESPGWNAGKRGLRRLRGAAKQLGAPLLLVLFPIFDSQLDERYAYRDLHELLTNTAATLKIPSLDLLPAFEEFDARRLAVVPFTDAHPSPLAHRIAAKEILDHLVETGMIPARMPAEVGES